MTRSNSKETIATLVISVNDTDFTHEQLIGGNELYIKYHIPALYPLESCSIEIENKKLDKTRASWISLGFDEHVSKGDYTLFENLNWLNRNLELLLSTPPTQKTEEQEEAESISAAQQKDLKPPVKAAQQQQPSLSVTAAEFMPQQQPKSESKKKTSLFDEENNVKKNKVIIVNDPSLVIEQADEEEVEVELAPGEDEYHHHSEEEQDGEKTLVNLSQPAVRRGTEIRLVDPKLENISLFRCTLLHIMVKCARCKDTVEVENIKPEQEEKQAASSSSSEKKPNAPKTERWMSCPTCSSVMGIKLLGGNIYELYIAKEGN